MIRYSSSPSILWLKILGKLGAIGSLLLIAYGFSASSENGKDLMYGGVLLLLISVFNLLLYQYLDLEIELSDDSIVIRRKIFNTTILKKINYNTIINITQNPLLHTIKLHAKDQSPVKIPVEILKISGDVKEVWPQYQPPIQGYLANVYLLKYELQRRVGLKFE